MESKGALKLRWSANEVAMLVEEWAAVCNTPGSSTLRGDSLNEAIFDRCNARCARARLVHRSLTALNTRRDRMVRYARFVVEFDRSELAQGRRSWYQLSIAEQFEVDIPKEWRRQLTTFTPEVLDMFTRVILPTEEAQMAGGLKRKKKKTRLVGRRLKVSAQSSTKQQIVSTVDHQPRWTSQEEVLLAHRWSCFMNGKALTLKAFEEMTFNKSCKRLASSTRSSFSAWRKTRVLLTSWRFIGAFNAQHQPGWFELTETERDLLIIWGELPNNFEDVENQVFLAMEKAVRTFGESEPTPLTAPDTRPSVEPLSPLPVPSEPTPLLSQFCPKDDIHSPGSMILSTDFCSKATKPVTCNSQRPV